MVRAEVVRAEVVRVVVERAVVGTAVAVIRKYGIYSLVQISIDHIQVLLRKVPASNLLLVLYS